jgi:MFS family permease
MYFLVFSQIVLGIGSATLGVTRAYVAEITATRQRTTYIALLTAVQYGAFTGTLIYATRSLSWAFFIHSLHYFHVKIAVTPIFGSIFSHFLRDKRYEVG